MEGHQQESSDALYAGCDSSDLSVDHTLVDQAQRMISCLRFRLDETLVIAGFLLDAVEVRDLVLIFFQGLDDGEGVLLPELLDASDHLLVFFEQIVYFSVVRQRLAVFLVPEMSV